MATDATKRARSRLLAAEKRRIMNLARVVADAEYPSDDCREAVEKLRESIGRYDLIRTGSSADLIGVAKVQFVRNGG